MTASKTRGTLYVAPGDRQMRLYWMPYPMRIGQHPRDLADKYQRDWQEVGLINGQGEVVCLERPFHPLLPDLHQVVGGTFFELEIQVL